MKSPYLRGVVQAANDAVDESRALNKLVLKGAVALLVAEATRLEYLAGVMADHRAGETWMRFDGTTMHVIDIQPGSREDETLHMSDDHWWSLDELEDAGWERSDP